MREYTDIHIPFEDFKKIPSFESITRAKRKIQNEMHEYMPDDDDVIKRRSGQSANFQAWAMVNEKI